MKALNGGSLRGSPFVCSVHGLRETFRDLTTRKWAEARADTHRMQTATLIVHGAADPRVHPKQSLALYTALKAKGVPTELVFYPRQPHGLVDRAHQVDFAERVVRWFDTYLK